MLKIQLKVKVCPFWTSPSPSPFDSSCGPLSSSSPRPAKKAHHSRPSLIIKEGLHLRWLPRATKLINAPGSSLLHGQDYNGSRLSPAQPASCSPKLRLQAQTSAPHLCRRMPKAQQFLRITTGEKI
ncbi:hypothetical protein MPTK1_1g19700 [Marchantia polymorpha subsp. ruderalis]|uniref:Uncharacterized protein n=2 Tax=Marchantia polymorpha TaxID=3197 RepID=A0AAF6AS02_MARPO|nr:hypothetical protein MARPO_0001s0309 [Marchantia polymorpha]BBM99222.1 hypothetical protein Mp_1g19700 [Marchantia polymorpha subsp. ruderalis]|eukprot:PTQ50305.1 hypothetical protein MARPO_0001s0309 [Marchantia polymorpha]